MHFGCSDLMLHSKSPIIRRKTKRKDQYCQTVKWAKRVSNKNWENVTFPDESTP